MHHAPLRTLLSCLLILLLAACGGGPDSPATAGPAAAPGTPTPEAPDAAPSIESVHHSEPCFPVDDLTPPQLALADSILTDGLDHEALFTLADDLKPMSTLRHSNYEIARDPDVYSGTRDVVDPASPEVERMRDVTQVVAALRCGPVRTLMIPLRRAPDGIRRVQLLAVHEDSFRDRMEEDVSFWAQWGLASGSDPATVITVVEFEESGARWRGYGRLFGYPEHAVTFFVDAGREQEETGEFVERDFFQIPTYGSDEGRFVYAIPQGHEPLPEDEAIRERAAQVLDAYRELRPHFENDDGTLRAMELLRAWYQEAP